MKIIVGLILVMVGLIHLLPAAAVMSTDLLEKFYGVYTENPDTLILLRHRAALFGLLGLLLIAASVRWHLQFAAIMFGMLSMAIYIILFFVVGDGNNKLAFVMWVDVGCIIALFIALLLRVIVGPPHMPRTAPLDTQPSG